MLAARGLVGALLARAGALVARGWGSRQQKRAARDWRANVYAGAFSDSVEASQRAGGSSSMTSRHDGGVAGGEAAELEGDRVVSGYSNPLTRAQGFVN